MWLYRLNHLVGPVLGLYWRLGLEGAVEAIPRSGPLILAANHSSFLDPWLLGMAFPRPIRFLINSTWFERSRGWNYFFRAFGTEPVKLASPDDTIEAVSRLLGENQVVGIFPEGRISRDGRMQRFRSGVARIAARSGAPVIPIGIRGSFASLPRSRRIPRPVQVRIHLGPPIHFPQAPCDGSPTPVAVQAFLGVLASEVGVLTGEMITAGRK